MNLVIDPFSCGEEDDETGVWTGIAGVPNRLILVVYVPDPDALRVAVVDINYA